MKRAIPHLLLILVIQCLLVAVIYWPPTDSSGGAPGPGREPMPPQRVDEVVITDEQGDNSRLVKQGDHWQLPGLQGLPADAEKISNLLDSLLSPRGDWPVASSVAARQRFQVADYHFQRRIRLSSNGEVLRTVYLGTSPGFRKVHARAEGEDAIHAFALNVFDAPTSDGAWLDPRLLQVRSPLRIDADTYSVHRETGEWRSGSNGIPDERELAALLSALRSLQVEGVAGEEQSLALAAAEAELVLAIEGLSGNVTLELFRDGDAHFIRSSEYPLYFKLGSYHFDLLSGIDDILIAGHDPL